MRGSLEEQAIGGGQWTGGHGWLRGVGEQGVPSRQDRGSRGGIPYLRVACLASSRYRAPWDGVPRTGSQLTPGLILRSWPMDTSVSMTQTCDPSIPQRTSSAFSTNHRSASNAVVPSSRFKLCSSCFASQGVNVSR